MVNIYQINELTQSLSGSQPKGTKSKGTDAFENALSQALDQTEDASMEGAPMGGLGEIAATQVVQVTEPSDIVSGSTDKLLGLLDAYASQLENPDVSLKNIAPMLEKINQGAGQLLKETESLGTDDAGLKNIATQTALTAKTEYVKFQRGDYVS